MIVASSPCRDIVAPSGGMGLAQPNAMQISNHSLIFISTLRSSNELRVTLKEADVTVEVLHSRDDDDNDDDGDIDNGDGDFIMILIKMMIMTTILIKMMRLIMMLHDGGLLTERIQYVHNDDDVANDDDDSIGDNDY